MRTVEQIFEELIATIERNAIDNKTVITDVKLFAKSWREELQQFGVVTDLAINANRVLSAVFLRELADLMKKHNATIELERVWDNEYSSHAELGFKVNERYLDDIFSTKRVAKRNQRINKMRKAKHCEECHFFADYHESIIHNTPCKKLHKPRLYNDFSRNLIGIYKRRCYDFKLKEETK